MSLFFFGSLVTDPPSFITTFIVFGEIQLNYLMDGDSDTEAEMSCVENYPVFDCRGHTMRSVMRIRQLDGGAVVWKSDSN